MTTPSRWSLMIHGGAGQLAREVIGEAYDAAARAALSRALEAGSAILAAAS